MGVSQGTGLWMSMQERVSREGCAHSTVVRTDKTWWETGEARNIVDQMVEGQKC